MGREERFSLEEGVGDSYLREGVVERLFLRKREVERGSF